MKTTYILQNLQKDLDKYTAEDIRRMKAEAPRRSFWLVGLDTPFKMILPAEPCAFIALGEYCGSRATAEQSANDSARVDCRYFAEWDRPYFYASALDAVFVRPFTAAEQSAFDAACQEWRALSAGNEGFLLHEDYADDLRRMADNFIYMYYDIITAGEDVADEEEKNAWRWACEFAGIGYVEKARRDEAENLARRRTFCDNVAAIFEHSLRFNVELLSHGKPRDAAERAAFELFDEVGAYNDLTPDRLKSIVKFCNITFSYNYGNKNPNNKGRAYSLSFGRESSPVLYIDYPAADEAEGKKLFEQLHTVAQADESNIARIAPAWHGVRVRARLWWD